MPYSVQNDMELIFGVTAISEWADVDEDGNATKKADRITRAILMSDAQIDAVLLTIGYAGPPIGDQSGTVPTLIMMLSAVGAAMWLYESTGAARTAPGAEPIHQYSYLRGWRRRTLEDIRTGKLKLDAV